MNIVVIGSCTDSSILAKELNKRLNNSIVARIDLLKNIKQLILQGLEKNSTDDLGAYVGDIECCCYNNMTEETQKKLKDSFEQIEKVLSETSLRGRAGHFLPSTFDGLTNSITTSSYSLVKIYSGAITNRLVQHMVANKGFIQNAIIVTTKSPRDPLLPITINKELLDEMKKHAFTWTEVDKIEDFLNTDIFQLLFKSDNNLEKKTEQVEQSVPVAQPEPAETIQVVMQNEMIPPRQIGGFMMAA